MTTIVIKLFDLGGDSLVELPIERYSGPEPRAIRFHGGIYMRRGNTWSFDQVVAWDFKPTPPLLKPGHA